MVEPLLEKSHEAHPDVLFIEPFYGGSHKQLIELLLPNVSHTLVTLKAKKWPWRARCSALILADLIPAVSSEKTLFCSSVLNLAELLGLRRDLDKLKKVVYFHENQFIYPVRAIKDRDIQFAYNQITTCLAADEVIFNSNFNRDSFFKHLNKIVKLLPDYRPKNLHEKLYPKCRVLYFPIAFPIFEENLAINEQLAIVWPHRWEFDKDPTTFLEILVELKSNGLRFKVHILGETFQAVPEVFLSAKEMLPDNIETFGYVKSKNEYFDVLRRSDVAVSTAKHEFFGVSMLEAVHCGCFPLVPNDLVYPEIYPEQCLYENKKDLFNRLADFCKLPKSVKNEHQKLNLDLHKFSSEYLLPQYLDVLR